MTIKPLVLLTAFLAISGPTHVQALDDPPPLTERVAVTVRAFTTRWDGATSLSASAGPNLLPGESGSFYFLAGDASDPATQLCGSAVGIPAPEPSALARSAVAWLGDVQLLGATMDGVRFRVAWSRHEASAAGLVRVAGDERVLTLKEGETHTLDFLAGSRGDRCPASVRIDVATEVMEDPALAQAVLEHDLWLVDEAPGLPTISRRLRLTSRQGESVDFALAPLTWPLDGILIDGRAARIENSVKGTLRARLREDGSIDAVLDADRTLRVGTGRASETGGVGDGGRKVLRLQDGETLSLVLPSAQGTHALALDGHWASVFGARGMTPPRPTPGTGAVLLDDDSVAVDFGRFLEGHELSLRLTTRRSAR